MEGKIARQSLEDSAWSAERTPLASRYHEAIQHAVQDKHLSLEQAQSFENAFDVKTGKKLGGIPTVDSAYFALGQRLYSALERIGYFGEPGKPLDYDSARTLAFRTTAANVATDFGASLFLYILSELRSTETRDSIKKELSQLIRALEERRGNRLRQKPGRLVEGMNGTIRAAALALWLLTQHPEKNTDDEKKN